MKLNEKQFAEKAADFLRNFLASAKKERIVIGLSGGIDSATALALAAKAIGSEKITAISLPNGENGKEAQDDATLVAKKFGISDFRVINIEPIVSAAKNQAKIKDKIASGNIAARARMIVLYAIANQENMVVLGTENKTEHYFGYFTKAGDEVSDVELIRDLYKTQVRALAKYLDVPGKIIRKPPTADLWDGQTDEAELGISYEEADQVLAAIVDKKLSEEQAIAAGLRPGAIKIVKKRMDAIAFKLCDVPYPKLKK